MMNLKKEQIQLMAMVQQNDWKVHPVRDDSLTGILMQQLIWKFVKWTERVVPASLQHLSGGP